MTVEGCSVEGKYFPKTWLLDKENECRDFFDNHFNTPEYFKLQQERHVVFIRKNGTGGHLGKGVEPMHAVEEERMRKLYENGSLCGTLKTTYLVQKYIHNPLLVNERKTDFRIYLLVASTNPLMAFYHDGFLRVSIYKYDTSSNVSNVYMTMTHTSMKTYTDVVKGGNVSGFEAEELKENYWWSLPRFNDYLLRLGKITDPDYLANHLRPEFQRVLVHVLRATAGRFCKRSFVYELYGIDFMMDDDLNVWFLEANSSPTLSGEGERGDFITNMILDHFEVVFSILRSRMKRVVTFINQIIDDDKWCRNTPPGAPQWCDIKSDRAAFDWAMKNRMEHDFSPRKENNFKKILDENIEGVARYNGVIPEQCLHLKV